ncbi:MAG TPA: hypothetical protein VKY85_23370, partial [Candidatus Angelobacter sp.]|nr:hypothetical protein [Candidatus Angelobacter sp.]
GLLSSRARLRFTSRHDCEQKGFCLNSKFHLTARVTIAYCLTSGVQSMINNGAGCNGVTHGGALPFSLGMVPTSFAANKVGYNRQ